MSHIALLIPELEAGGAQRVMLLLAREFARYGHQTDLILLNASGPLRFAIPSSVRVINLRVEGTRLRAVVSALYRLTSWIRRERPDALLCSVTGTNLLGIVARKLARTPLRLAVRHAASVQSSGAARSKAIRWLYPHADAVVALSKAMQLDLIQLAALPVSKVHYIPNPLDVELLRESAREPAEHEWFDGRRFRIVVSAGRLIPEKDHGTLLRAFALLVSRSPSRLILVGEGPERESLECLTKSLGIERYVLFTGFDPNPWRWIARADLFVLSSRSEGSPNVLMEAVALNVPAVVVAYDSSVYEIARRFSVVVAPQGSIARLAEVMESVQSGRSSDEPKLAPSSPLHESVDRYLAVLDCSTAVQARSVFEAAGPS